MPQLQEAIRRFTTAAIALCLIFGVAGSAPAQTDVTTSRMSGTVKDTTGAGLPGVTVEAKNQETGFGSNTTTDVDGSYRLLNLPTGRYTVTASLAGFNTVNRPDIVLKIGSSPTVDFTLQLSAVSETITVTSRAPVVEVTKTQASTTIEEEQIDTLPLSGRNITNLVLLTPEARFDRERGNIALSGQRGINTNVTVDGVDYNNSFFGGTSGTAEGRAPLSLSQEAVKEFTVITNGASVEFGRSAGGFVSVITKSGTNQMHGSAFYYDQPQSLIADFADGREPADQNKRQYGASLGGPIMRDRLFYFGTYDEQKQEQTVIVNSRVLDADIARVYPILASDPEYTQGSDGRVLFGRLDFQAYPAHRFMIRGNYTTYEGENGTSSSASRTSNTNGIEGLDSRTYVGSYSGTFGSSLLNDLNVTLVNEDTPREDKGLGLPEIQFSGLTFGEVSFLPIFSTVERFGIGDTVSYLWGKHVFKAGADYNDTSVDQIFKGNWRGVFVFNGTITNPADKQKFLEGRWDQYRQFGGLGGLTADEAGGVSFGQKETALFIQDQWYASPSLTFSAGIRWERLDNPDDPVLNPNDLNADGTFKLNGQIPDVNDQYSPRIGVTWSPFAGRTVVRATAGRFWSRTPALLFAQLFSSNGVRGTQYVINAGSGGTCPTDNLAPGWGSGSTACRGGFTPQGVERIDFTKVTTIATPGVFAVDPDFTNPRTDRATVGFEQEILRETAVGLEYTYAETENLERLTDINIAYQRDASGNIVLGANGLPRYSSTRPNRAYGRVTTYVSDARSEYWALSATFRRRFAEGLRAFAYVTYSKDKDNDSNERNFSGIQAEDFNDLEGSYGFSARDQRWRSSVNVSWDTPWWGIFASGSYRYTSGEAFNATTGTDTNGDGFTNDRPTVNGVHFERNSFRQPGFRDLSLRLGKAFDLGPGSLMLFGECFNCTDYANRSISGTNQRWGTGQTPLATFGVVDQVTQFPRTIQLAVRYDF